MKKKKAMDVIRIILMLAAGLLIGILCGKWMGWLLGPADSLGEVLLVEFALIAGIYLGMVIQLIVHEAGHLVFGLLSGYRFCSFRVFQWMWLRQDGKLRCKRLHIAGTAGQCLMVPPEWKDGKIPVIAYNLGGSVMNLLVSAAFLCFLFLRKESRLLTPVLISLGMVGVIFALMNGIPMRTGTVDNDGYNAIALSKDPQARRAFWLQLKINEQITAGVRLKDMPEEWFAVPSGDAMKNSMVAAIAVFACNRLMDEGRLEEADDRMARLLSMDSGMPGLYRYLLTCDRMSVELLGQNRSEVVAAMRTAEQLSVMKKMKTFPSVLRTQYLYTLLGQKDMQKAQKLRKEFDKVAKTYPNPCEIISEQELMALADQKACVDI